LAGAAYNLMRINSIVIPAEELDITGAETDVVDVIDIREYLPDNIKLAESGFSGKITATAFVEPIINKTLTVPIENVSLTNIPQGYEAEITDSAETTFTLEVSGLGGHVNPILQENVMGTVDVSAWMQEMGIENLREGSYNIPVKFALDENITLGETYNVRVVIKQSE